MNIIILNFWLVFIVKIKKMIFKEMFKTRKDISYFKKIIWVIGLIILVNLNLVFSNQLWETANAEFNPVPVLWFDVISPILLGIYIAILLVKKWSININHALLWCVSAPCLLLLLTYPTLATLSTYEILPESFSYEFTLTWLFKATISMPIVFGIVGGMTLTLSLFSNHSKATKNYS